MQIICLCRAGFEKEVASEIGSLAASRGVGGYVKTQDRSGFVRFVAYNAEEAESLISGLSFRHLVFIRHWFLLEAELKDLDTQDRVSPIVASLDAVSSYSAVYSCALDTNDGKSLAKLTSGLVRHIDSRLRANDQIAAKAACSVQLLLLAGDHVLVGRVPDKNRSPWASGIPRLRVPRTAPSRATLKLEEGWLHFIPDDEMEQRLRPSMQAVDLGAAPGGWTWQLVNKSMFVDAVDNGPMDADLMASGQVTHHQADGFSYVPRKAVDWLVCDIADKPAKVAKLIARWAGKRWFTEAIFNLKLPMKQRYNAVEDARALIADQLSAQDIAYQLDFKQLYHDREEVTGHLRLM